MEVAGKATSLSELLKRREVGLVQGKVITEPSQQLLTMWCFSKFSPTDKCPVGLQASRPRFNETLARKLAVEDVLQGHDGCVNRLAWNEEGDYLASGSDDRRVCAHLLPLASAEAHAITPSWPGPSPPPGTPVHARSRQDTLVRLTWSALCCAWRP